MVALVCVTDRRSPPLASTQRACAAAPRASRPTVLRVSATI